MTALGSNYDKVIAASKLAGISIAALHSSSPVDQRYRRFMETVDDWHTACRRFDSDFGALRSHSILMGEFFKAGSGDAFTPEQQEFFAKWGILGSDVRLDVRAFYIFSKIPVIAFGAVLFAMVGNLSSLDWHSTTELIKVVKKPDAPQVFIEFNAKFSGDLRWFQDHINLYRNKFIEHPYSGSPIGGMMFDEKGAKLTGLTGRGVSERDEALMSELEIAASESFSGFSALTPAERYLEVCRNLDRVPEAYRQRAEAMILRVGLESGELEPLAARLGEIFAEFVAFFAEWKKKIATVAFSG